MKDLFKTFAKVFVNNEIYEWIHRRVYICHPIRSLVPFRWNACLTVRRDWPEQTKWQPADQERCHDDAQGHGTAAVLNTLANLVSFESHSLQLSPVFWVSQLMKDPSLPLLILNAAFPTLIFSVVFTRFGDMRVAPPIGLEVTLLCPAVFA